MCLHWRHKDPLSAFDLFDTISFDICYLNLAGMAENKQLLLIFILYLI